MLNLDLIISNILNINATDFTALKKQGMRPVKAAIRLGAPPRLAQLIATLQLATTSEEITNVYGNDKVKSCMTGEDVGPFYSSVDVGVIYSDMFRVLVNTESKTIESHAYGFHNQAVMKHLTRELRVGTVLPMDHTIVKVMKKADTVKYHSVSMKTISYKCIEALNTPYATLKDEMLMEEYVCQNFNNILPGYNLVTLRNGTLVGVNFKATEGQYDHDDGEEYLPKVGQITREDRRSFSCITNIQECDFEISTEHDVLVTYVMFDEDKYSEKYPEVCVPYLDSDMSTAQTSI